MMSEIGEAVMQGLMHGTYVGLTGDRTRATEMRKALEERWTRSRLVSYEDPTPNVPRSDDSK